MNGKKLLVLLVVGALLLAALPVGAASVPPVEVAGNPTCAQQGYAYGVKWNYPEDSTGGTYPLGTGTVTWSTDGTYVDWESTFGVDAVIVKGGNAANVYKYDPPVESFGDTDLVSPNNSSGKPAGLSHVEFCYDYEVEVTKTANTTFTRDWDWKISKTGDQTALTLSVGQQFLVNYQVKVETTGFSDSDWAVSGTITIYNPDPGNPATITGVTDSISGVGGVDVNCGVTFPYVLAAGGTLECSYSQDLPDGSARINTATVTTSGKVGGGSDTADVTFGEPTTKVDECVDVSDTKAGDLGTVCAGDSPVTLYYSLYVGPYAVCGEYSFTNTASYVGGSGETGSASHSVAVTVPCATGCTLTQGYWKTHSEFGPAPYDDTWAQLPNGASTTFFLSLKSYYQVLWTPPAGNAYYNLAHQYIAAKLNVLNGAATTPIVDAALAGATGFFNTKTPLSTLSKAERQQVLAWASTLDGYNNGKLGVPHCSE